MRSSGPATSCARAGLTSWKWVLVLPVAVRRGERRYPFELTWLPTTLRFLTVSCPACCDPAAALAAGRHHLGCRACLG